MTSPPSPEDGLKLALALLGDALDEDGTEEQAWALVFASGVVVDEDTDPWQPTPEKPHPTALSMVAPGTANYAILRQLQADEPARIRYTCTDLALVEIAKADPVARRACMLLSQQLEARGDQVPDSIAAILAGEGMKRRHGPNPAKRATRDRRIVQAILGLKECGYPPHLGEGKVCGIALVRQALEQMGSRPILSYDAVRTIWRNRERKLTAKERKLEGEWRRWGAPRPVE